MADSIVTLVVQHHVNAGAQAAYEAWLGEIMPAAQQFTGHLGVNVIRPVGAAGAYTIVLRFDSDAHLQAWVGSETRRQLIAQVAPLLAKGEQVEIKTGLEYWFTPPDSSQKKARPFKQFLVTLSAIFPLTLIVPWLMTPLFGMFPAWALPVLGKLCVAVVIVGLMTYVIMPRYTKLIARWLFD